MAGVTAVMGKRQRVVVGIVSAALGVLVAEPLAGTAALLPAATSTLSAPTVQRAMTVPSVTVPAATVPSVSTPLATTPKVTTPAVTTPSVSTPSVTAPRVTTPSVTTPAVHTPVGSVPSASVPSASAPSVSAPSHSAPAGVVRSTGSGSSSTAGSRANATSGAAAGASPMSGATSTSGSGSPASRSNAGSAPAAGGTGESRRGPSAHSPRQRARAKRLLADRNSRRLRRQVARLRGCLQTLQPGARRLLALRAGLNGPARSAQATARILHVSDPRETRLERRALRALQRSAVTGCAAPATVVPATAAGIPAGQGTAAGLGTAAGAAPVSSVAADPAAPAASLSSVQAHRAPRGGRRLPAVTAPRVTNVEQAVAGSSSINGVVLAALLALLLGLGLIALPEVRRRLLPTGAATGAAEQARPARRSPQVPAAGARTRRGASTARMDEALAPMAADVFARLTQDPAALGSHAQPEGDADHPHAEVEDEKED